MHDARVRTARAAAFAVAALFIAAGAIALYAHGWRLVRVPTAVTPQPAAGAPRCVDMFVPGKVVQLGDARCLGPNGEVHTIGWHACTGARRLATVDATTGAPAGYAFDGQPYVVAQGDLAADRRFAAALDDCKR